MDETKLMKTLDEIYNNFDRVKEVSDRFAKQIADLTQRLTKLEQPLPPKITGLSFVEAMKASSEGKRVRLDRPEGFGYISLGPIWFKQGSIDALSKQDFLSNEWRIIDGDKS